MVEPPLPPPDRVIREGKPPIRTKKRVTKEE
jgi:hypothetical protein